MPYIRFESGQLAPGVAAKLIEQLTATSAEVTGIPREYFFVTIDELPNSHVAIGGKDVDQLKRELESRL